MATKKCGRECEVFSRIVGYYQPIWNWNLGKQEEFKDRLPYKVDESKLNEKDIESRNPR